jgi:simple sugar transport system permease protein
MTKKQTKEKKNAVKIFVEELSRSSFVFMFFAIFTGLVIGGILAAVTTEEVIEAFGRSIGEGFKEALELIWNTYSSLFIGSFGEPRKMITSLFSGDREAIRSAFKPFLESMVTTTPYIFTGVAIALGFQAGIFNIGAEGQLFMGSVMAAWAGFAFKGLKPIVHIPFALGVGFLAGALWGFIPGWLKAKTGAHEVINTIMMNYIAFNLTEFLIAGPFQDPVDTFKTPNIEESAKLLRLFEDPIRFNIGTFLGIGVAVFTWYMLYKTTWGYEIRSVGLNPNASRYAGINATVVTILSLTLSGAFAALGGATMMLGVIFRQTQSLSTGYGFDSIAVSLLAKNHPLWVIVTAMLFGFMRHGSRVMQLKTGIPIDIISILQGLIIFFLAAPAMIRTLYRLKEPKKEFEE